MTVQIGGSLLVLAGFALSQWGVLNPKSITYLVLNLIGSAALAVDATLGGQWGSCSSKAFGRSSQPSDW